MSWLVAFTSILLIISHAQADWMDDIGYIRLAAALGSSIPNGAGVPISLVEAPNDSGAYFPDTQPVPTDPRYTAATDPFNEDVDFTDGSGMASNGVSSHAASTVGSFYFGNTGPAAGANVVTVYEANHWLTDILHSSNNRDPEPQDFRVQNFSWISSNNTPSDEAENRDRLRRFDYVIDHSNVTAMVGLNNGTGQIPHLLGHSYNAIAVGRTDGLHSAGPTLAFYGPGRTKPDIVAPLGTTSSATGVLSSAATILHQSVAGSEGTQSEVVKAMLLAGATKEEIVGWSHTTTQPLDSHYGAGELNVYNSYLMTEGGQMAGSTDDTGASIETTPSHGWDYQMIDSGGELFYNFEVASGSTATELSIILAWNVEVTDSNTGPYFSGTESLVNLDLALYDSTTSFLGTLVDESISPVDNIEHIYQKDLGPGIYTLKISSDALNETPRDFGLAWRLNTLFDVASADFDGDGDVDGTDFLSWQRGSGALLGAIHADGDADGDTDVDADDLAIWQATFGTPPPVAFLSVPEPGTLALALLLVFVLVGWKMQLG